MFPFHLIISIIIDYQSKSPDRLFSMIDYENPNNRTTLPLTLCLLVSSADNLANRLEPDQARKNVGPDLDPNGLTLRWYSWKKFFEKIDFKKKETTKCMQNYPAGKDLNQSNPNDLFLCLLQHGEEWHKDVCTACLCFDGSVTCTGISCLPTSCGPSDTPTVLPGSCCPVCLPSK